MTTPGRDGERLRKRVFGTDNLVKHVGCGSVDDAGCCPFCELIRAKLARCDALETALREKVVEWRQRIAISERDVAAGEYSQAGCDSERGKRCTLRECIADINALLSAEPPAPDGAQEG